MLSFRELTAELEVPAPTLILLHRNPDGDAVGSAFALKEMLTQMGSITYCLCGNEIPERLRFLSDEQTSILPEALPDTFRAERVVAVDIASPVQLGALENTEFTKRIDLMIDHHKNGTPFAKNYILPDAAATGEILFSLMEFWAENGKIKVTKGLASRLYAAVSSDTGCFRYSNAAPKTHTCAAKLLSFGIDAADVNHRLFETKTLTELQAISAGISNLKLFGDGKIGVISFPYALKKSLGIADENLDVLIDYPRSVEGVKVAISIRQPSEENLFRVSVRSSCDFDVSALCAKFGGGGHCRAAGCSITAPDMETAIASLIKEIPVNEL